MKKLLLVFVLLSLLLAACGGATPATQAPSGDEPAATSAPAASDGEKEAIRV